MKNRSFRLGLERTGADAVFCADPESVVRSVEMVIHLKEITQNHRKNAKITDEEGDQNISSDPYSRTLGLVRFCSIFQASFDDA